MQHGPGGPKLLYGTVHTARQDRGSGDDNAPNSEPRGGRRRGTNSSADPTNKTYKTYPITQESRGSLAVSRS